MYVPSQFEERRPEVLRALIAKNPLATLVAATLDGVVADHIPVLFEGDVGSPGGARIRGHVAKVNPLWKQVIAGSEVLAVFQGSDHYVTPRWYPTKQQDPRTVPTWNYAVVHVRGEIVWHHEPGWLHAIVEDLTNAHESAVMGSVHVESTHAEPWRISDAPVPYIDAMLEAIVGFEISVASVIGKWKVSQNRKDIDRQGVFAGLHSVGTAGATDMASLVKPDETR